MGVRQISVRDSLAFSYLNYLFLVLELSDYCAKFLQLTSKSISIFCYLLQFSQRSYCPAYYHSSSSQIDRTCRETWPCHARVRLALGSCQVLRKNCARARLFLLRPVFRPYFSGKVSLRLGTFAVVTFLHPVCPLPEVNGLASPDLCLYYCLM